MGKLKNKRYSKSLDHLLQSEQSAAAVVHSTLYFNNVKCTVNSELQLAGAAGLTSQQQLMLHVAVHKNFQRIMLIRWSNMKNSGSQG
ncbi:Pentatricopeptide repeat-containing protein [Trichinella spiralis]|uniref:Pentatricopeptide repeat-containing protein n=1 Tax=Trichinella spiralis TaxID=6334 RepID=A0ABR3KSW8_TRISP